MARESTRRPWLVYCTQEAGIHGVALCVCEATGNVAGVWSGDNCEAIGCQCTRPSIGNELCLFELAMWRYVAIREVVGPHTISGLPGSGRV